MGWGNKKSTSISFILRYIILFHNIYLSINILVGFRFQTSWGPRGIGFFLLHWPVFLQHLKNVAKSFFLQQFCCKRMLQDFTKIFHMLQSEMLQTFWENFKCCKKWCCKLFQKFELLQSQLNRNRNIYNKYKISSQLVSKTF